MNNNRKILVSDYDGTFFLNEIGIKENVNKVNQFRKETNLFVIATGNNWKRFKEVIHQYNIKCDYLILDQGSCIFDNQYNLLKAYYLDFAIFEKILQNIKQINKKCKICNPYNVVETIEEKNITKIAVDFINLQDGIDFANKINKEYGEYVNAYTMSFTEINIVEIISSETDKNEAIKYIMDKEKISKENVYTVGDGYNDISMIQNFNGYCMKNSVDKLLEKCQNRVNSVADLIEIVMNDD